MTTSQKDTIELLSLYNKQMTKKDILEKTKNIEPQKVSRFWKFEGHQLIRGFPNLEE